jgi:micrococcal nuclease
MQGACADMFFLSIAAVSPTLITETTPRNVLYSIALLNIFSWKIYTISQCIVYYPSLVAKEFNFIAPSPENIYNNKMKCDNRRGDTILTCRTARLLIVFFVFSAAMFTPWLCRSSSAEPATEEARVLKVHDGDTVTLLMNGKKFKTRLIGMDAPEMGQRPWGKLAKKRLIDILSHTDWMVLIEKDVVQQDNYGRLLAYIWTGNKELINELMVLDGYAVLLTIPPNIHYADRFTRAEHRARQEKKGIWGPNGLKERPGKYRKKHPRKD